MMISLTLSMLVAITNMQSQITNRNYKYAKIFENYLNPVMLVLIE